MDFEPCGSVGPERQEQQHDVTSSLKTRRGSNNSDGRRRGNERQDRQQQQQQQRRRHRLDFTKVCERSLHLEKLQEQFEKAQQGYSSTIILEGPSGCGKSTLIETFLSNNVLVAGRRQQQEEEEEGGEGVGDNEQQLPQQQSHLAGRRAIDRKMQV